MVIFINIKNIAQKKKKKLPMCTCKNLLSNTSSWEHVCKESEAQSIPILEASNLRVPNSVREHIQIFFECLQDGVEGSAFLKNFPFLCIHPRVMIYILIGLGSISIASKVSTQTEVPLFLFGMRVSQYLTGKLQPHSRCIKVSSQREKSHS